MTFTPYDLSRFLFVPSVDTNSIGLGLTALDSVTTGTNNTALGANAGTAITTGSNNIVLTTPSGVDGITTGSNTLWIGGGTTATISATGINGATPVVTIPGSLIVTGTITNGGGQVNTPVAAGATLAVTAAMSGKAILLNTAAGSVVTLPAATGSGSKYRFVVTTTASSNAHKILPASVADFMNGIAVGHTAAGATLAFSAAAATAHSIQMPFAGTQPSGGFIGDWFEIQDVAANLWTVAGMYQAGTTATTPFSAATT